MYIFYLFSCSKRVMKFDKTGNSVIMSNLPDAVTVSEDVFFTILPYLSLIAKNPHFLLINENTSMLRKSYLTTF